MKSITIYTTPNCSFCRQAKAFFAEKNLTYTEIDVLMDREKQQEMLDKSGQLGVPVINIDGQIIVGFSRLMLAKLLGIDP